MQTDHSIPMQDSSLHSSRTRAPYDNAMQTATSSRARVLLIFIVIAVLCAYLLPGTLGHDPWKQDETYTFGIIQHMLETGEYVVPTNAGQPFLEKPPLYYWVATGFARLFGHSLPIHDAARLTSTLFMLISLACLARLARLITCAHNWLDTRVLGTLALFAGTLIVIKHSHDLMTDVALMAGAALGFCGLFELVTVVNRKPEVIDRRALRYASIMLGIGTGIALMTKGLFIPLVLGATVGVMPLLYPACRKREFWSSFALAICIFAPFALLWPSALYLHSEALFKVWFWDNNVGRFFGFSVPQLGAENDKPLYIWRSLFAVGFPVAPLAAVALIGGAWRRWREPHIALPVIFCGIGLVLLQISATARALYILPFIAPLALLAIEGIERLPQRLHTVWDLASRALFGCLVVLVWVVWAEMANPSSSRTHLSFLGRWLPLDWTIPIEPHVMLGAFGLTIGWLCLMPFLARTGKWRGALSWCIGTIVAWGLVFTLLVSWIDMAKSYRSVFDNLAMHIDNQWTHMDCLASWNLGESEAPMLYYFTGILHKPTPSPDATTCRWLIVQSERSNAQYVDKNWELFWSGARPADHKELLRVFVRKSHM